MSKIVNLDKAVKLSEKLKLKGEKIVISGGCFDILHKGHLAYLNGSKKQADALFILLESDENVKRLKGEKRPINNQQKRAQNLAGLTIVDFVVLLPETVSDGDYFEIVKKLKPEIIAVTKGDPMEENKRKQAESVGGEVVVVTEKLGNYSTTKILGSK